jgi:hypothetical protein
MLRFLPRLLVFCLAALLLPSQLLAESGGARNATEGSLRVQLLWTDGGVEIVSVQISDEASRGFPEVVQDPRVRRAEHIDGDGRWTGGPIRSSRGASVLHLPLGTRPRSLTLEHRGLGQLELPVPAPSLDAERGVEPELIVIRESGEPQVRQDWVFLAEGYRPEERDQFLVDVNTNLAYLEGVEPYSRYLSVVNVWALFLPSTESGADHLELATPTYADTALGCHYGAYGIDRLIDCDQGAVLRASAFAPGEDVRFVLVNDSTYGGSGGQEFAVSFNGEEMVHAVVHEMGHSDGNLADEYSYEVSSDPPLWGSEFPNCSASPSDTPWEPWVESESEGVGAFLVCSYTDYFRPTDNGCLMRDLQDEFCVVCRESLVRTIYGYLDSLILGGSEDPPPLEEGQEVTLGIATLELRGEGLHFTWIWTRTDHGPGAAEVVLAEGGDLSEFDLEWGLLEPGLQTIVVRVEDRIDWVLTEHPEGMSDEYSFSVLVEPPPTSSDDDDDQGDDGVGCGGCGQLAPPGSTRGIGFLLLVLGALLRRRILRAR